MLTYAIGDIHGRADLLNKLLIKIARHAGDREYRIVTLGDYVDRGPDSKGVLDTLMGLPNLIALRGNHEAMFLAAIGDPDDFGGHYAEISDFLSNGGQETLDSFGISLPGDLDRKYLRFLWQTKFSFQDERRFYVHAGVDPTVPLNEQTQRTMMYTRSPFLNITFKFEKYVVHGHTPQASGWPDVKPNRCNLDTKAWASNRLTCGVFGDLDDQPFEIIQT